MYADAPPARRLSTLSLGSLVVAASLALTGCTPSQGAAPTPTGSGIESGATSPSTAPSDDHDHAEGEEDDHPSVPIPEAGADSQADAATAATTAVTVFARPTLTEAQWWSELLPLLSQKGAVAYEGTLPSKIPVTAVTGTATVLPASTEVATLVEVPTDAGPYIVTLVRGSSSEPWLAERIRPAGQ